jgi:hypothetical protein
MAIDTLDDLAPATPATTAEPATSTQVRSRRALLTAALGGLGGLLAARLGAPSPAAAAAGDPLLIGNTSNTAGTANTSLITASTGTALLVTQNGPGTALRGSAVGPGSIAGFFTAANGTGISGVTATPNTYGIFGSNDGAAGTGAAIRASGKNNNGLVATTANSAKAAVVATNSAFGGTAALFESTGGAEFNTGPAVRGYTDGGSDADVHPGGQYVDAAGEFAGFNGVIGASTEGGFGVYGRSPTGNGVRGETTSGDAVAGTATTGFGVSGQSVSSTGVFGGSQSGIGVWGRSLTGYAGNFEGQVRITKFLDLSENGTPATPAADTARLFVRDNGANKTELCVIFPGGNVVVIGTSV